LATYERKREARRQTALDRLGSNNPRCTVCGETDWRCLEAHHVAGRAYNGFTSIVCRNCHRKLSDVQKDQPAKADHPPLPSERIGHFLLGLADFFLLLAGQLRQFGGELINLALGASTSGETRS
jgi:hypothetical protein